MSKPVAWLYQVNENQQYYSDVLPPDDAYDEGTLIPLYTHPVKQLSDEEIIEKLAELEHRQWMMWATNIVSTEEISKERKDRWFTCMVAYSELSEEMKEHDRVWARQALAIIKEITE